MSTATTQEIEKLLAPLFDLLREDLAGALTGMVDDYKQQVSHAGRALRSKDQPSGPPFLPLRFSHHLVLLAEEAALVGPAANSAPDLVFQKTIREISAHLVETARQASRVFVEGNDDKSWQFRRTFLSFLTEEVTPIVTDLSRGVPDLALVAVRRETWQFLQSFLSGGQKRAVEITRILYGDVENPIILPLNLVDVAYEDEALAITVVCRAILRTLLELLKVQKLKV